MSLPIDDSATRKIQIDKTWPVLFTVWATFVIYSLVASPIPGVNEPHYLCKARNFWHNDWCARDFFLTSPNAHSVFYVTIGSLTQFLTLWQSALIGRILALLILAWGWTKSFSQLLLTTWGPLWCAWICLAFCSIGNFSGEWVVGGVEGKVLAYGFLLVAYGEIQRSHTYRASIWTGIAVSFHPVVGIWGITAFVASRVLALKHVRVCTTHSFDQRRFGIDRWMKIILPFLLIFLAGLPGLIPVFRLLSEQAPPETRYAATYLQVYFRLKHHLDPMMFPLRAYLGYAALLAVWISSLAWGGSTVYKKAFDRIVLWSIIIAVVGIVIGYGPRPANLMPYFAQRMQLLKFYPFRFGDALLPIAVAVSLTSVLERTILYLPTRDFRPQKFVTCLLFASLIFAASLYRAHIVSDSNRYSLDDRTDWLDVCQWIDRNLPKDAIVQSPTNGWAFKWFAHRAEYVAFKDCPQDAAGIVEWNRRLNFLKAWFERNYADEFYSADELRDLRKQTEITHLLTDRLGPLELDPIYRNGKFQVYDLTSLER